MIGESNSSFSCLSPEFDSILVLIFLIYKRKFLEDITFSTTRWLTTAMLDRFNTLTVVIPRVAETYIYP